MIGSRWRVADNGSWANLECDFQPLCRFCKTPLIAWYLGLFNFPLNEPDWWERGIQNGHAVDVICICPECGYRKAFGVALDKEHWWKLHMKAKDEVGNGIFKGEKYRELAVEGEMAES